MTLRIRISNIADAINEELRGMVTPVAEAATAAMREVADTFKKEGRANIASAGFSSRWQNTFRVNLYPSRGVSLSPAVYAFHKIPYAEIFETGGTVKPKGGLLWLPFETTPKVNRKRATPELMKKAGVKLFSYRGRGNLPILGAHIRAARESTAANPSMSRLRLGVNGKGPLRTVPLFFGKSSVKVPKKFDLFKIAEKLRDQIATLYFNHLRTED